MNQVPDREKLRREYLRRKGTAYTVSTLSSMFLMPFMLLTLLAGLAFVCLVVETCRTDWRQVDSIGVVVGIGFFCLSVGFIALCGWCTRSCWRGVKAADELHRLPYVPPVIPDTLPAEEILVRGSEQPLVAQSGGLLRAIKEQETLQEELLRVAEE